jgi:uncharacterized OB-fold protein
MMADPKPFPLPDLNHEATAPLWQAAARGEFALPRCKSCGTFDWYPKGQCRQCNGENIEWTPLSGRGTLFSWAVVKRALHKPLAPVAPYVSAIVAIEEDGLTRMVTRLIDCDPAALHIGMPVAVRFADLGYPALETGIVAPLFAPSTTSNREEA